MGRIDMVSQELELKRIYGFIRRWGIRLRLLQSAAWLPRGLAAGLVVSLGIAVVARLWPILTRGEVIRFGGLAAGVFVLLMILAVWLWRRSPQQLARKFDRKFGLKERLSTALELAEGCIPGGSSLLVSAQRADTLRSITNARPLGELVRVFDWRDWAAAAIVLGAVITAVALPNPQEEILEEQAEIEQAVAEQIEELEELRIQALEDPALTEAEREAVVEAIDEAIETLSQDNISREEALAALDAAERELNDLSEQAAAERREALEEAGQALAEAQPGELAEALQEGDLQAAAEALESITEGMTADELAALAEQLEALAASLEGTNPELAESLQEAADALQAGDVEAAQTALDEAAGELSELAEGSAAPVDSYSGAVDQGQSEVAGQETAPQQPGTGEEQGEGSGLDPGQEAGETPRGGGAPDGGERPVDDIYAPQHIGGEGGEQVDIPGDPDSGVVGQEGDLVENPTGESTVPYTEVWTDYEGAVNEALQSGYVPLGMRDIIQQYFSRLDPE
nr:hypothetical protein [Anaerolineae bacterium]